MEPLLADICASTPTAGSCPHECQSGFQGGSVTCKETGQWVVAGCTEISCPPLLSVAGRSTNCTTALRMGDTCSFVCDPFHISNSPVTCGGDGAWSATPACAAPPTSIPNYCFSHAIEHGSTCAEAAFGSWCSFSCTAGYQSVLPRTVCWAAEPMSADAGGGIWSPPPTCTAISNYCLAHRACRVSAVGTTCNLNCGAGYVGTSETSVCSLGGTTPSSGIWTPALQCQDVDECLEPSNCPEGHTCVNTVGLKSTTGS